MLQGIVQCFISGLTLDASCSCTNYLSLARFLTDFVTNLSIMSSMSRGVTLQCVTFRKVDKHFCREHFTQTLNRLIVCDGARVHIYCFVMLHHILTNVTLKRQLNHITLRGVVKAVEQDTVRVGVGGLPSID